MGVGRGEAAALGRVPVAAAAGTPAAAPCLPKEQGQGTGKLLPAIADRGQYVFMGLGPPSTWSDCCCKMLQRIVQERAAVSCRGLAAKWQPSSKIQVVLESLPWHLQIWISCLVMFTSTNLKAGMLW